MMGGWKQFKKSKAAVIALIVLGVLYTSTIFANFFAPYRYDDDDVMYVWSPPAKIHLFNSNKKIFRPFIYHSGFTMNKYYHRVYESDENTLLPVRFFVRGFPYKLLGLWEADIHLFGVDKGRIYLLGADDRGRDIFSRLLYGARISLSIGLIGVAISFTLGMIIGGISGYFGGWKDTFIMRLVEMMMLLPGFYFLLALRSGFPLEVDSRKVFILIVFILSFISWPGLARVIRGMVMSIKENEYILAAKALGLSHFKIIRCHILPNTLSYVSVAICLSIPGYIIMEAALSFLGLGIQEPFASWGNMLVLSQGIVNIQRYPWILAPGIAIAVVTMSFNIIGNTLRDIFDPKRQIL